KRKTSMPEHIVESEQLSPQQRRVWLLQHEHGAQPYRAQCALLFQGNLDRALLKSSLHRIIKSYGILHTTFLSQPESDFPLQVVTGEPLFVYYEADLRNLETGEQGKAIDDLFWDQQWQCFNLEQGPVLHTYFLRLAESKHILLI